MRVVIFCHSLISDWNHGNAHFLRGIALELLSRGHDVAVYEPVDSWSRTQLLVEAGTSALHRFQEAFPALSSHIVDLDALDLDEALDGADVVLVHEWNTHDVVRRIGEHRARAGRYTLLFHDTHHRAVTDSDAMAAYQLTAYDGVLVFGEAIRERYLAAGWNGHVWTWHEAADVRTFMPLRSDRPRRDLVWIGNWGDDERSEELHEFLFRPARELGLTGTVYGVRYPPAALEALSTAGLQYGGWVPNFDAPRVYASHRISVHIPRRPYMEALPGIPTIRVFEVLACGLPLVSLPWHDVERLFVAGADYLVARTPSQMREQIRMLLNDDDLRQAVAAQGLATIRRRHTCAHRVDELFDIVARIRGDLRIEALTT